MSRSRLFVLIDTFERDMRRAFEFYLLSHIDQAELFGDNLQTALDRQSREGNADDSSLVHYLDLRPCYDIMLRNRGELAHELAEEMAANVVHMDALVPIRHRVMHGRPLHPDDPERALSAISSFSSRHWQQTKEIARRLSQDPAWEPAFETLPVWNERVLHNLPEPDYDETGFVGRQEEAVRIIEALKRGRDSIITITGEGGIGKTALALDIAYRLLDTPDCPFEAILWTSLKSEKLTAFGVEDISDALRGIEDSVAEMGRAFSDDFAGRVKELADILEGINCLIIIDNLESVQGSEVIELYETLPDSVTYLFTSRLGIGEVERRYPLPALREPEARLLFRKFAARRGQRPLAGLTDKALDEVLKRLRYSPLAIRWYVLSTEAGMPPLDTLRNQRDLLEFCVKNVFDGLQDGSRAILTILRALDRSISFDEFAVLTDMAIDSLRFATQELTRGSLVVVEAESAGSLSGRLSLTATARAFLPAPDRTGTFLVQVLQRERQFKARLEESRSEPDRIDEGRVYLRDSSDGPAAHLLGTALTLARSGQFTQAQAHVERARTINPEYSEVYRVSGRLAVMEGRLEAAVSEFQNSLMYATDPLGKAVASYALAASLARKMHDPHLALPYAKSAYELQPNGDTAFLFGTVAVWAGDFELGQGLIEVALERAHGRHRLVVTTALVDSWGRWADSEVKNHNYASAAEKAWPGIHLATRFLTNSDSRLIDAFIECCVSYLRAVVQGRLEPDERRLSQLGKLVLESREEISESRKAGYLRDALLGMSTRNLSLAVATSLAKATEAIDMRGTTAASRLQRRFQK